MPILTRYNQFYVGGWFQYSYSPLYPDALDEFDRRPLIIWLGYDNSMRRDGSGAINLMGALNVHWLTVSQRKRLVQFLITHYRDNKSVPFRVDEGVPIYFTYQHVKKFLPDLTIAFRKYFPNRIRNVENIAIDYNDKDLDELIIHTDTENILGVSPQWLQKQTFLNAQKKAWNQKQKQLKAKSMKMRKK